MKRPKHRIPDKVVSFSPDSCIVIPNLKVGARGWGLGARGKRFSFLRCEQFLMVSTLKIESGNRSFSVSVSEQAGRSPEGVGSGEERFSSTVVSFRSWVSNYFLSLFAAASWMPLLLFGFIAPIMPANAQRLPEPRIYTDELPSPSPSSIPSINFPTSPLPPALPNDVPDRREFNFQAPNPLLEPTRLTPAANLYRVDILGDSPSLLLQVQRLEPKAFVREGEGVIQAGVFAEPSNAQSLVRALAAQGIRARVTPMDGSAGTVNSDRRFSDSLPDNIASRSYLVVIPGDSRDLPTIAAQVVRLGVRQDAVSQREAPRGPHVAVGPFNERREADRWSSYLRSLGMDARVYFGR